MSTTPITSSGNTGNRDTALDFTKGALVVIMVVYHWGNIYLWNVTRFFDLLRFLTPSFIFITGWLLGALHQGRREKQPAPAYQRLILRGLKLIALFTALNLVIHSLGLARNRGGAQGLGLFFHELFSVYASGNTRVASFRVLLPIGYLLLLAGPLLWAMQLPRIAIWTGLAGMAAALQAAEWAGMINTNLMLLSFGVLGLGFGYLTAVRVASLLHFWPAWVAGYAVYLALIMKFGPYYWVQLIGVILSLLLIYSVGKKIAMRGPIPRTIDLLGRYSLFGYIAQIAILQGLVFLSHRLWPGGEAPTLVLTGTAALTIGVTWLTEFTRRRVKLADSLYRVVFN